MHFTNCGDLPDFTSRLGRKKQLDGLSIGNPQGLAQGADRLSENFIGMAPEVCLSQPYGVAVDVYSWAVVAFEIWSLRGKPFSLYSLETHAEKVVVAGERPRLPVAIST